MRTLVESTFVTLDGVIESPQEWSPHYWEVGAAARDVDGLRGLTLWLERHGAPIARRSSR